MLNSKRIIHAALAAFLLNAVSYLQAAQQKSADAGAEVNGHFEAMSKELNLTEEQKPKIKAIVDAQMQQWAVLGQNKTLNGKQKIAKMREINADAQARIDKILTPQQRQKLQSIMEQAKLDPGKLPPKRQKPSRSVEE